ITNPRPHAAPLSLHDALPISQTRGAGRAAAPGDDTGRRVQDRCGSGAGPVSVRARLTLWYAATILAILVGSGLLLRATIRQTLRSEEHTSELQSRENLVCRLL